MLPAAVGGVTALQEVRVRIPRTCEHVNLRGQGASADILRAHTWIFQVDAMT